jgi:hypothetical protein
VKKLVLTLEGGDEGPDLAAEEEVNSPVGLVTAIWNHAPKMEKAFAKEGIQWPNFIGSEMADLVAYLQAVQRKP